jgi:hypothetical protein
MTLILLTCYNKMTMFDADEFNKKYPDHNSIPAKTKQFKDYLELEKWREVLLSGDKERINKEMEGLQEALKELNSEDMNYEDKSAQREEDIYIPNAQDKKLDLSIFGINFNKLDDYTKHILGFGLIITLFAAIIYGLKWIKDLNVKVEKKKKNK